MYRQLIHKEKNVHFSISCENYNHLENIEWMLNATTKIDFQEEELITKQEWFMVLKDDYKKKAIIGGLNNSKYTTKG